MHGRAICDHLPIAEDLGPRHRLSRDTPQRRDASGRAIQTAKPRRASKAGLGDISDAAPRLGPARPQPGLPFAFRAARQAADADVAGPTEVGLERGRRSSARRRTSQRCPTHRAWTAGEHQTQGLILPSDGLSQTSEAAALGRRGSRPSCAALSAGIGTFKTARMVPGRNRVGDANVDKSTGH